MSERSQSVNYTGNGRYQRDKPLFCRYNLATVATVEKPMSISVGNLAFGLVIGAVLGFSVNQFVHRTDARTDAREDQDIATSGKSGARQTAEKPNQVSSVAALSLNSAASSVTSDVSKQAEFNLLELTNRQSYSESFSAELALINSLATANFDQLETLARELFANPRDTVSTTGETLRLAGLRMLELDGDRTLIFLQDTMSAAGWRNNWNGMHTIIPALAITHHEELLQWSESLSIAEGRQEIQSMVLAGLARQDPLAAITFYEHNNQLEHNASLYAILNVWSEYDAQAAMQWAMNQVPSIDGMDSREMIFSQWLISDPVNANAFLQTIDDPILKTHLQIQANADLATRHPRRAIEQVLSNDDNESRRRVIETAMYSWGAESMNDAIDYATNSLSGAEQEMAYAILGESVSMHGREQFGGSAVEIMQMSESLPPAMGERVRQGNMQSFFREDPDGALQWLNSVGDTEERNRLLHSVAWELPQYDLAMAQSLFEQSDSMTRSMLAPGIAQQLHESDASSAWYWYEQLPDESIRQEVFFSLVQMEAQTNPEEAMRLAQSAIGANSKDLIFGVFAASAYEHPEWARQWLEQASMDEEQKMILRSILEESRFIGHDYYETQYQRGY